MDFANMMQMAKQLRERLGDAQAEAAKLRVNGESGGGLVKVVMNGHHEVLELTIDPTVLGSKGDDIKLLEDLIRAAVNQASSQVANGLKDRMGSLAQDMGVDLSMFEGPGKPK